MNAELVTIGTELLLGQIVDTNAAWLAQRLAAEGVNLFRKQTVGDNRQRVALCLREALARADVVLTSGGLGPTVDDITREAIADATDRGVVREEALVRRVEKIFARWGRKPGENNLRQADLPEGGKAVPNPIGTAPGVLLELENGKLVIAMPGVPREMKRMFDEQVVPLLRSKGATAIIKSKILHVAAMGESLIDEKIEDLERLQNPTVGLAAHAGQVGIRITARAATEKEADVLIAHVAAQVRRRLKKSVFGEDEETLGSVVAALLAQQEASVAVYEALTGGLVAETLRTGGAQVAASVEGEAGALPSEEDAEARTRSFAAEHGAEWGLAIYSNEGDDIYDDRVGESFIVVTGPEEATIRRYNRVGVNEYARQWLKAYAIETLRRSLLRERKTNC